MGVYAEAAKRLMGADPVQAQPMPTPQPSMAQQMIARYEAAQQRQQPQPPPETPSQRLHRNLLGDRSPRPTTQAQITQRTDARLQQIQQKPVYLPAYTGQPLQSDFIDRPVYEDPNLSPGEQTAAKTAIGIASATPIGGRVVERTAGGVPDFGTVGNIGRALTRGVGEAVIAAPMGITAMGAAGAAGQATDLAFNEQQRRQQAEVPQRGNFLGDLGEGSGLAPIARGEGGLDDYMRALSIPTAGAANMAGVKLGGTITPAFAKSTWQGIKAIGANAGFDFADAGAETAMGLVGQGLNPNSKEFWDRFIPEMEVNGLVGTVAGRVMDVPDIRTGRALNKLDTLVKADTGTAMADPNLPPPDTGLQPTPQAADLPVEPVPVPLEVPASRPLDEVLPTEQPIQPAAITPPVEGTETQPPVELPKSEQFLKRLGVTTPVQEAAAAKAAEQAPTPPEATETPQPVVEQPAAATPPPEPPVRAQITPDTNPEDIDTTLTRANIETIAKRTGTNLLTDSATDTPEKIDELYTQATGEGYHKPVRVMDTANRVMEAHVKGERPSLSPLEVAGLGVRMTQLQLKIKRMDRYIADPEIPEAQKMSAVAELNNLKSEFSTIADARVIASGNSSMALNAIRKAFPELGPTGASLAKQWEMQKKAYTAKGKTVSPEADAAVKKSFKELDESIKRVEAEETSILKKKNELIVKEMAKESRPSTADEKMANIKRILDENNGCDL